MWSWRWRGWRGGVGTDANALLGVSNYEISASVREIRNRWNQLSPSINLISLQNRGNIPAREENGLKILVIQGIQAGLIYIKSLFSLLFYKHQSKEITNILLNRISFLVI